MSVTPLPIELIVSFMYNFHIVCSKLLFLHEATVKQFTVVVLTSGRTSNWILLVIASISNTNQSDHAHVKVDLRRDGKEIIRFAAFFLLSVTVLSEITEVDRSGFSGALYLSRDGRIREVYPRKKFYPICMMSFRWEHSSKMCSWFLSVQLLPELVETADEGGTFVVAGMSVRR